MNALIKTIRLLGNLSNRSNYMYTEKDVEKIFRSVDKELRDARARFRTGERSNENIFKL